MNRWAGVARMGGLGDNMIAASVLHPLKRLGYMTDVITVEGNHVVYLHNPNIDRLSIKRQGDIPEGDMVAWQAWFRSRANEYDLFLHASHSCEGRHALTSTMTAFWWSPEYRRKICGGSYLETVHDIINVPHEFGPLFYASPEEKERAQLTKKKIGDRCIGWILSGSRIDKVYPFAAMAIGRFIRELNAPVVMFGAPNQKDFSMAQAIDEHVKIQNGNDDGLHLALTPDGTDPGGEKSWPVRRSLTQIQACDVVVTPDTGSAWAVAFEQMPKVVMVSHASAENITKHWLNTVTLHADPDRVPCHPCHRLHDSPATCVQNVHGNGAACISDISVERLLAVVRDAWTSRANVTEFPRKPSFALSGSGTANFV